MIDRGLLLSRLAACCALGLLAGCGSSHEDEFRAMKRPVAKSSDDAPQQAESAVAGKSATRPAPSSPPNVKQVAATTQQYNTAQQTKTQPAVSRVVRRVPIEAPLPAAQPRKVMLLVAHKEFRTEGKQKALRVSYDDLDLLKVLNMEPVTPDAPKLMPEWLKNLEGRRVRIRGFMYPTFEMTGIRAFALARDNQICCFGRDPKVYDVFDVFLKEGESTDYIANRPFDVVGVFHIKPENQDGKLYRLYEMKDAEVIAR